MIGHIVGIDRSLTVIHCTLMSLPADQNVYSRRWEDAFEGAFGLQLNSSLDYSSLTAHQDLGWPFFLPSGTADLPPVLQPSAATLVGISEPWSPSWQATCVNYIYWKNCADAVEGDHHGLRSSSSGPMLDVNWTKELTDRTARRLGQGSQPVEFIPVKPTSNPTQGVSAASLFPDLSLNHSTPLSHLSHIRRQSPRFEGDLYAALWVSGEGADRTGWCGYCSLWHKLKDSAYWVRTMALSEQNSASC